MDHSWKVGITFGLASGTITTLGLMVGLYSGTRSLGVVIGGILTIAIADAFSDALGIHVSEESENRHSPGEIWVSTLSTFASKLIFTLSFVVPFVLFPIAAAVTISLLYGTTILLLLSAWLARQQKIAFWRVAGEHLLIGVVVVGLTHLAGRFIAARFVA